MTRPLSHVGFGGAQRRRSAATATDAVVTAAVAAAAAAALTPVVCPACVVLVGQKGEGHGAGGMPCTILPRQIGARCALTECKKSIRNNLQPPPPHQSISEKKKYIF
jgi:hypothetical protein